MASESSTLDKILSFIGFILFAFIFWVYVEFFHSNLSNVVYYFTRGSHAN